MDCFRGTSGNGGTGGLVKQHVVNGSVAWDTPEEFVGGGAGGTRLLDSSVAAEVVSVAVVVGVVVRTRYSAAFTVLGTYRLDLVG